MADEILERFSRFVEDQAPAIAELREFIGGEVGPALDGSLSSLASIDRFIASLTSEPGWARSSLFRDGPANPEKWLTVRVAYYFAQCLRNRYGCEWRLSSDADSPVHNTPVLVIGRIELSPLEISRALIRGEIEGGLAGLVRELDAELQQTNRVGCECSDPSHVTIHIDGAEVDRGDERHTVDRPRSAAPKGRASPSRKPVPLLSVRGGSASRP